MGTPQGGIPPVPQIPSSYSAPPQQPAIAPPPPNPPKSAAPVTGGSAPKIPSIRLSFITAQDQAQFEQLFKAAVGEGQAISGERARDLLIRSKLPATDLGQIWWVAQNAVKLK